MLKITPIRNALYTKKTINKVKNTKIIPRILTGVAISTFPLLSNCSKIETPIVQEQVTNNAIINLTRVLEYLNLLKISNDLNDITNIGFSDADGNRNYIKFKKLSKEKIDAEYLKLNADKNIIDSAQLTIEKFDKDIKLNIIKENNDSITQLYKLVNREIIQYNEENGIFVPNSKLQKNSLGFIQIFNSGEIKYFNNVQNNELIIIKDDSLEEIEHEFVIN